MLKSRTFYKNKNSDFKSASKKVRDKFLTDFQKELLKAIGESQAHEYLKRKIK